jgi:hypothetical protein
MIVINLNNTIFPNPILPKDEWFREISKLYVAMTRAKKELIISYSKNLSSLFMGCRDMFNEDDWDLHIPILKEIRKLPRVDKLNLPKSQATQMVGKDFIYHKKAIGMSRDLQNKILDLVQGKSIMAKGKKEGWIHIDELKNDILSKRDIPHYNKLFGPVVFKELEELFIKEEN